jgi:hypothetical protein
MQITHTDILWILEQGMEYDLHDKHKSLGVLATRIRGVLRAKYEPLVFRDEYENDVLSAEMMVDLKDDLFRYKFTPELDGVTRVDLVNMSTEDYREFIKQSIF